MMLHLVINVFRAIILIRKIVLVTNVLKDVPHAMDQVLMNVPHVMKAI